MIFELDRKPAHHPALVDADGTVLTYGELSSRTARGADLLRAAGRRLVFLLTCQTTATVVAYLACLEAGFPVCLVEGGSDLPERLRLAYHPDLVLHGALPDSIEPSPPAGDLHPDLALLLTTSGSTGSPKLVRLTRRNVEANAASIAEYLEIGPDERAMASLPVSYSYGLSVLNSHLLAGASVVLTDASFLKPEFWAAFRDHACTSFAGVPFMYETLARLRFDPAKYPSLRTMTQAGGRLKPELVGVFRAKCAAAGVRFVVNVWSD